MRAKVGVRLKVRARVRARVRVRVRAGASAPSAPVLSCEAGKQRRARREAA